MRKNNPVEIRELIKERQNPILPFEIEMLRMELGQLGVAQGELSRLLGEAMEQSSETWHDNAPADAVNSQSHILTERAESIISKLSSAVTVEYPDQQEQAVTLGSIIEIRHTGDKDAEKMLLTGVSRTVPESSYGELEAVTVRSPLGAAVLGHLAGENTCYMVNSRPLEVEIVGIQQVSEEVLVGNAAPAQD